MQIHPIEVENFGKKKYNPPSNILLDVNKVFSIEVSHIYIDQPFSDEHVQSIQHFQFLLDKIKNLNLCILVDDYNPTKNIFNLDEFLSNLKSFGIDPIIVASETRLVDYYSIFSSYLNEKEKKNLEKYIDRRGGKLPCSLLIAIWNLVRLGEIKVQDSLFLYKNKGSKDFVGEELITILPKKFSPSESRASKILFESQYKNLLDKIHHLYF